MLSADFMAHGSVERCCSTVKQIFWISVDLSKPGAPLIFISPAILYFPQETINVNHALTSNTNTCDIEVEKKGIQEMHSNIRRIPQHFVFFTPRVISRLVKPTIVL
jgi:hypothetical protein